MAAGLTGPDHRPATFADALRCEWTKFRTLRSTFWTLLTAAVLGIGLGALFSAVAAHHYASDATVRPDGWNPTSVSLRGLALAQLAFAVLGVLVVSGEYSTGLIRTSLAAVPRGAASSPSRPRPRGGVAGDRGVVSARRLPRRSGAHLRACSVDPLGRPDVLRAVVGSGLYLAALGLLGVALGMLLRHRPPPSGSSSPSCSCCPVSPPPSPHGSRATSRSTGQPWPAHR